MMKSTVKPLSILTFKYYFPCYTIHFVQSLKKSHQNSYILLLPSFLKVLFYGIHHSEFLVLTQNIPGMTISEVKGQESHAVFLECKVAVTCLHRKSASISAEHYDV
jgi:uncharacterized membrane protein YesL